MRKYHSVMDVLCWFVCSLILFVRKSYDYFKGSALMTEALLQVQSDLADILRLRESCATRWLSYAIAVRNVFACSLLLFELYLGTAFLLVICFISVVALLACLFLFSLRSADAQGLLYVVKSYKFDSTLYAMNDTPPIFDRLSKTFQTLINMKKRKKPAEEKQDGIALFAPSCLLLPLLLPLPPQPHHTRHMLPHRSFHMFFAAAHTQLFVQCLNWKGVF